MSAPLSPPRCVCQATSAVDSTAAEHEKWCPSRKPTPERLAELKTGTGRPLMDGELEWLRGDANRSELHVIGARGGHWTLTDDLPGAVLELARELGAMVAEVDRLRPALNQSENDLTGARLSLWEEEQDTARLRVALESAKRGRRELRAELYTAQAHGRTFMEQRNKRARELLELRKRVAALEAERHATNEALTAAVERVAELETAAGKVAAFVAARAEFITAIRNCHPDNAHDYHRWQGHAESRRQLAGELGLPVAWPAETPGGES